MNRFQFKLLQGGKKIFLASMEFSNPLLSQTDPSQSISVDGYIKCVNQGLPVPQNSEISVHYNGVDVNHVGTTENIRTDVHKAAIELRREQRKINNNLLNFEKNESKKNSSK